ncbi:MAG TPA: ribonuclease R, partial [Nevskiaceae bacterium]|nr:ribonuclease R [Nevskiaceae bacterium]
GPLTFDELIAALVMAPNEPVEALRKRLDAMVRDGQIVQNRKGAYGPVSRMNLIAGEVQAHRDGFGFLIPDAGGPDIFLGPRQMRSLMNGDRVLVRIVGTDQRGRPEGTLAEVIERASRDVVGRLHIDQGVSYVIPDNPRVQQDVLIPPDQRAGARHGQMVVAELTALPGSRTLPVGRIKEVLGDHLAPGMEIVAAIRAHNLPHEWPAAVEREAEAIPATVQPEQMQGREDVRHLPLVTIDGADARDFDDAVHARPDKHGWTLWVAIADVSAYVRPGAPLDVEATKRGNSVYFPRQVIPMLPEKLSNGLCSINPEVDRLCMVCEMRVGTDGEVEKSRFYEGVMRSQARLIYEDVADVLEPAASARGTRPVAAALMPHLHALRDVYQALFRAREKRGAIDFDTTETRIVFSGERKIERIEPIRRNIAHRLIEECMVAANVQAAMLAERCKVPTLYRVHERPDPLKVAALREFLSGRGIVLGGGEEPRALDYARALAKCKDRPDAALIQGVMLRSMMQAQYNPQNTGHYGLALEHYAHFTSPIRRYPDLLLHRALKHALKKKKGTPFEYSAEQMAALGTHCSMTERRADEATREVANWLKCEFMSHRVGEEFDGVVSGVTSFGLFVMLDDLYIDGLVHVSSLKNDYYEFDAKRQRLVGSRTRMVYALGERVHVRVTRVSLDERKIDLELTGSKSHSTSDQRGTPASRAPHGKKPSRRDRR